MSSLQPLERASVSTGQRSSSFSAYTSKDFSRVPVTVLKQYRHLSSAIAYRSSPRGDTYRTLSVAPGVTTNLNSTEI